MVSVVVSIGVVLMGLTLSPAISAHASGNYASAVLADAPAAYWRLGESSGTTAADASSHNQGLAYQGGYTLGSPGAVNGDTDTAVAFNGTTSASSRGSAVQATTANWTIEAWVNPQSLPQLATITYNGIRDTGQGGYGFGIGTTGGASGSGLVGLLGSAGTVDSGYTFPAAHQWYHVVEERDSTTIRFYVNGTQTSKTSAVAPTAPGSRFSVGAGINAAATVVTPFNGSIDEAAAYGSMLPAGRIAAHYEEGVAALSGLGSWSSAAPTTVPPSRYGAATAYDPVHSKVVMFGGVGSTGSALNDTWTWDGTTWTKLTPTTSPSARSRASLVWDAATNSAVLFGGLNGSTRYAETWSWDGTNWTLKSPVTKPTTRSDATMVYNPVNSTVLMFGGYSGKAYLNETWRWDGTTWSKFSPATSPGIRSQAAGAFLTSSGKFAVFGGYNGTSYLGDSWLWDGTTWAQVTPGVPPAARAGAAAFYDATTSTMDIVGGYTGTTYLADTWGFDGAVWAQEASASAPTARDFAATAYDAGRNKGMLFGGYTGSTYLSDTWSWKTPPSAPASASASAGNGQATVTFTAPQSDGGSAVTGYSIIPFNGTTPGVAVQSATSPATVGGLTNGTAYTFRVFASSAVGNGLATTTSAVTPKGPPGAPTAVSATRGDGQATVSWTAPSNTGGSPITGYVITPYTNGGTTAGTPVTFNNTTIPEVMTGLVNGTSYTFAVAAINAIGTGPASSQSSAVTPATVPGAPTGATAVPGNTSATVSWTAPSNTGGAPIAGYVITPYTNGGTTAGTPVTFNNAATTETVNGLTNGTSYTFAVAAINGVGTGPLSSQSAAATPATVAGAPTGVSAIAGNAQAVVSWAAPTTNGGGAVTGYVVTPYTNNGTTAGTPVTFNSTATSQTVSGLGNGTSYTFAVAAINSAGTGPSSSQSAAVTPATTPGVPTGVSAAAGNAQATVSWAAPASSGGSAITGYVVTPYTNGGTTAGTPVTFNSNATSQTVTGLANGTSYTFTVAAINAAGTGGASAQSNAVTPATLPGAPTGVSGVSGNAQVMVSWVAPSSNGGAGITGYVVTPYTNNGNTAGAPVSFNSSATTETVTGLVNGTSYTFTVAAINGVGAGPASAQSGAVTPATIPDAPTSPSAAPGAGQATVGWTAPVNNGGATITSYRVTPYAGSTAGSPVLVSGSSTSAVVAGLNNGTTYTFRIAAVNAAGTGPFATTNAVAVGAPDPPTAIAATSAANIATVTWTAGAANASAITGFLVTGYTGGRAQNSEAVGPSASSATLTGLKGGTAYTFVVTALNVYGFGVASSPSNATTPGGPATTYASMILGDGPSLYYRLGDGPGPAAADSAGGGDTGTYQGAAAPGQSGALVSDTDPSVSLPGSGYVALGTPLGLSGDFTVEAWVNLASGSIGSNDAVAGVNGAGNDLNFNNCRYRLYDGGSDRIVSNVCESGGAWAHYVVTRSGSNLTMYRNGQQVATGTWSGTFTISAFGAGNGGAHTTGSLDEVAVYRSALSAAQVSAHYQAVYPPPPPPTGVTAAAGANQATVNWTAPGGGGITRYLVTAFLGSSALNSVAVSGTTTSATLSGLRGGSAYTIQVVAYNNSGGSAPGVSPSVTPTGGATTYASTVIADGPAAYYRLGDPSGTAAADSSGNTRTGTYQATPYTLGVSGALPNDADPATTFQAGCCYFGQPTAGSYMQVPAVSGPVAVLPTGNAGRTLEAWVNTTSAGGQAILGYGTASTHQAFQLRMNSGNQLQLVSSGDDPSFTLPYTIANGTWHHIAVSYDGTTATAYVDGQSAGTATFSASLNTVLDGNGLMAANDFWCWGCSQFSGSIDEVAVYPTALSGAQVAAHFNASGNSRPVPTTVTATGGANQATVNWPAFATSAGAPVTNYLVTAYVGANPLNAVSVAGTVTTATISGLQANVAYTFRVVGSNAFGSSSASSPSNAVSPTGAADTYASKVLSASPSLYYRLGDPSGGVAADSSGHARSGVFLNPPFTQGTLGALPSDADAAASFQSGCCYYGQPTPGGYLQYRPSPGMPALNSARSIETWVKTSSATTQALVGYGHAATDQAFQVRVANGNQIVVVGYGDDRSFTAPYAIQDGNWHHVAVTYDGLTLTAYLDGVSLGNALFTSALNTSPDGNGLVIGNDFWCGGCSQLNGSLDEVAVYPVALTADQVGTHFNLSGNTRPVPTAVTAVAGTNQATVSWNAFATNSAAPVRSYLVTAYLGTQAQNAISVGGTVTSAVLSGLQGGIGYTFTVVGTNYFGNGPPSTPTATVTPSGPATTYASSVISSAPSVFYRLGDPSGGAAADSSGFGRNGALINPPFTQGVGGALPSDSDSAATFQPGCCYFGQPTPGGYMQFRPSSGLPSGNSSRTVETWFKTGSANSQALVGYGQASSHQAFQVRVINGNQVQVVSNGDDPALTAPHQLADGNWHQLAVTYDGSTLHGYIDGLSIGTANFSAALNTTPDSNGLVVANDFWCGGCSQFNGSVDEVAVYPTVLTPDQVATHFNLSGNMRPAPTAITATAGSNQATVTWPAFTTNAAAPVSSYVVTAYLGAQAANAVAVAGTSTSATVSGLVGGASYSFKVVGTNYFGNGAVSSPSNTVVPAGQATTYASTVLGNQPIAYYRLGDPSGSVAADSSGNGRHAAYLSSPYALGGGSSLPTDPDPSAAFHPGCCYFGQPTPGAYLQYAPATGMPSGNAARTVEAWFSTSSGNTQAIAGYGTPQSHQAFVLRIFSANQVQVVSNTDDPVITLPFNINNGNWHHIAATYNGTTVTIYVDGSARGTATFSAALNTVTDGNGLVAANDFWSRGSSQFDGSLDEVAVFGSALSAGQVSADYAASGNSRPTAPSGVTATAGANQALVSWSPATGTPGSPVTGYIVTALANGTTPANSIAVSGATTTATLTGLRGGISYTFQAVASNNFGAGPPSVASNTVVPSGSPTTYVSSVLTDGPAAYYRLGDPSGNVAADSSSNGRNGLYLGSPYTLGGAGALPGDADYSTSFQPGCCYYGQPTPGGYMQFRPTSGLPAGNSARSMEAWFKTASTAPQAIAGYGTNSARQAFQLRVTGGNALQLTTNGDDWTLPTPYSLADTQWHQAAVTYDGSNLSLYLDGRSLGTGPFNAALATTLDNNGLILANDFWSAGGSQLNGSLDEVAVYPTALSGAQVAAHFSASGVSYPLQPPGAPTQVSATSSAANQAVVSWQAPSSPGGSAISGYNVYPVVGSGLGTPTYAGPSASSVTVSGVGAGNAAFVVSASNGSGSGPLSAPSSPISITGQSYGYEGTILGDSPLAYWRLGEASGLTASDASGHGNTGSLHGTVTLGQSAAPALEVDPAAAFDGASGDVSAANTAPLSVSGDLTLETWVRLNSLSGTQVLVAKGDGYNSSNTSYDLEYDPARGGIRFDTYVGVTRYSVNRGFAAVAGQWYHVIGTRTAQGSLALYVNGSLVSIGTDSGGRLNRVPGGVWLGSSGMGAGTQFFGLNGTIDEPAIYGSALSPARVQAHWAAGAFAAGAPSGVSSAASGANQASVSWTAPAYGGTSAVSGYLVTPTVGGKPRSAILSAGTGTSANVQGLSAGTAYSFTVAAVNSSGSGAQSTPSTPLSSTGTTYPYASAVLADTPAAYWRLGDPSAATLADAGGSANTGAYSGGVTVNRSSGVYGDPDPSVSSDGTSGQAVVPNASGLRLTGALSVEAWVNLATLTGTQTVVGKDDGVNNSSSAYELVYDAARGGLFFDTFVGGSRYSTSQAFAASTGTWYHVVATRAASGALTLYINGNQVSTGTDAGGPINDIPSGVGLGSSGTGTGSGLHALNGSLDDVSIYPTTLSQAQVSSHWYAGGYVPTAPRSATAAGGLNQVSVSWQPPSTRGASPISSYVVTTYEGSTAENTITVSGTSTGASIGGLRNGASYSFAVQAVNASGRGAPASSPLATTAAGSVGPGLGQAMYLRARNQPGRGIDTYGVASQSTLPAMSQWTVEGWMWGLGAGNTTTGSMAWGLLGGSAATPSTGDPVAGMYFDIGANCFLCPLQTRFEWPGGGQFVIPGDVRGLPSAADGNAPAHFALDYDGTNVRGFINGTLLFTQAASGAAVAAAPAGFMDQTQLTSGYFDEFRVSSVARYSTSFVPQQTPFASDGSTQVLYHFDDYPISKLPASQITPTPNGCGLGAHVSNPSRPGAWGDSSGHNQHASVVSWSDFWAIGSCSFGPELMQPYSLGQGVTPDELTGEGSPWMCQCKRDMTIKPVDTATGEFWHTFSDLSVPGRGIPLSLSRTYASTRAAVLGAFGYGWANSYGMYLSSDSVSATVHAGNGSAEVFTKNGSLYQAPPRVLASLVQNGDGTFTLTDKARTQTVFDPTGKLIRMVDANNYVTSLGYSGTQLTSVTDPAGRALTFQYGTNGLVSSVTDVAGRQVVYTYDGAKNLTQVADVNGGLTKFTYDANHLLLTMKDPNCSLNAQCAGVVNHYDSSSRVDQQTDDMGRVFRFAYDGWNTTITDPNGNVTVDEYVNNILVASTQGSGSAQPSQHTLAYDPTSLGRSADTDVVGRTTTAVRDAQANIVSQTDPMGRTTTSTYNAFSEPLTVTDASGVTTTSTYDGSGNLQQTSRPLVGSGQTATTVLTYGDTQHPGDVTRTTDPNGKNWLYSYDTQGNRTSATDPLGDRSTTAFDSVGRPTSGVSPRGNVNGGTPSLFTTTYNTNAFGDVTGITDPLGNHTAKQYDLNRNVTQLTDANNHVTRYVYDLDDELTQTTRADNSYQASSYDADGNLLSQTDGLGHPTSYTYDALNRSITMSDPLNRTTRYAYNAAGDLVTATDPQNRTTTYGYDAVSEPTSVTYSDVATPNATLSYDALGQRVAMTDGTGTTSYNFDSLHRLTQSTNGAGAQVGYGHDLKGQLTSIVYPAGRGTVTRGYDDAGRLASVTDWATHTTSFSYNADSAMTQENLPNGVQSVSTFDNADRLTGITATSGANQFLNLTYGRDNVGNLTSDSAQPAAYDPINRVTSSGSSSYTYDGADRLTQRVVSGGNTTTQAYDIANQLQTRTVTNGGTQIGQLTYTYDASGNRTQQTDQANVTTTMTYDQANRLKTYGPNASYTYDAAGTRASKTVSGTTTQQTWDVADGLSLLIGDGSTSYVTGPGGLPLEQVLADGTVRYYHCDQLGSTRALTDSTGALAATYAFDSYGNQTSSTGTVANPFGYAGQYSDAESGLIYLRARYYDPATGQFISRDPAVARTRQPYSYGYDNPLNRTDPSGLWGLPDFSAIGDAASLVGLGAAAVEAGAIGLTFIQPELAEVTVPVAAAAAVVSQAALGVATVADTAAVIQHGLNGDTGSALAFDALGLIDVTHVSVITRFAGEESRLGRGVRALKACQDFTYGLIQQSTKPNHDGGPDDPSPRGLSPTHTNPAAPGVYN